jgi:hypothetical protein
MSHPRSSSRHLGQYTVRKVLPPTYPSAQLGESPEESEQLVPEQLCLDVGSGTTCSFVTQDHVASHRTAL